METEAQTLLEYPGGCGARVEVTRELYFSQILANVNDPDSGPYLGGHVDQQAFHAAGVEKRFRLYAGGGRGGKSRAGAAEMGPLVLTPGTKGAIVCPKYTLGLFEFDYLKKDLDRFIAQTGVSLTFEPRYGGAYAFSPEQGRMYARLVDKADPNRRPSEFKVYSSAPGHEEDLVGAEWDWVIFAEASNARSREAWDMLRVRLRSRKGIAALLYNPKGPSNWVSVLRRQAIAEEWLDWWVGACHADKNPGNQEKSIPLAELSEGTRRRMIEGEESSEMGYVFDRFRRGQHVRRLGREADPRKTTERWGAIDFGYRDPFVALFAVVAGKGKDAVVYVHREYRKTVRLVRDHGKHLAKLLRDDGGLGKFQGFFADWDAQARSELRRHASIVTKKADKDIQAGVEVVNELFADDRLILDESCKELVSEIEGYEWGEGKEEPAKGQSDHGCDALRYLCLGLRKRKIVL